MLVKELISRIDPDTESRVKDACRQFKDVVRESLKQETRFVTRWTKKEDARLLMWQCPVQLDEIGYPTEVGNKEVPPGYELAALLSMWIPTLKGLNSNGRGFLAMIKQLRHELDDVIELPATANRMERVLDEVEKLLALTHIRGGKFDLAKHVLAINEDVLGIYRYRAEQDSWDPPGYYRGDKEHDQYVSNFKAEVYLYWGVIGLIAQILSVPVHGLTVVVLAHELAHAFTHLGFDRDGHRWTGHAFMESEPALKEALAQYYAARLVNRLESRIPSAKNAYDALLPKQPDIYRGHLEWLDSAPPELFGATLSKFRRMSPKDYAAFSKELRRAKDEWRII